MSTSKTDVGKLSNALTVPFELLDIHGQNPREDLRDIKGLANSVERNRIRQPLKGYRNNGYYFITDGKRRFNALSIIQARNPSAECLKDIPFILIDKNASELDILEDQVITNDFEKFTALELAETVKVMTEAGRDREHIGGVLGKSKEYVSDLLRLSKIPDRVKDMIRNGIVSATFIRQQLKEKTFDAWLANYDENGQAGEAGEYMESEDIGKPAKVSKAKITAANSVLNSMREFKRFMKNFSEVFPNDEKRNIYEFAQNLVNNQLTYDQILDIFTDEKTRQQFDTPEKQSTRAKAKKGTSAKAQKDAAKEAKPKKSKGKVVPIETEAKAPKATKRKIGYIKPTEPTGAEDAAAN